MIGVSLSNILESKSSVGAPDNSKNVIFRRNIYGFASYKFIVSKNINIQPSILFRSDIKKMQFDYTLLMGIKNNYFVGLGYRGYNKKSNESVILLLGLKFLKNLVIMYSYDVNTSRLFNYQFGSHELTLNYAFIRKAKSVETKMMYNPRFL